QSALADRAEPRLQPREGEELKDIFIEVAEGDRAAAEGTSARPRRGSGNALCVDRMDAWSTATHITAEPVGFSRQSRAAASAAGRRGTKRYFYRGRRRRPDGCGGNRSPCNIPLRK